MPRSKTIRKRVTGPDPKFNSIVVAKIINQVMKSGKKTVAQNQVYKALKLIKQKTKKDPLEVLETALKKITPQMEVRSRRVGGAAYQVPMPVKNHRGSSLSIRWLVNSANKRPNSQFHSFSEKLSTEVLEAIDNQGGAIERKVTSHKMADANKAFAHFRW
jgi:small subunit ribosomal protein S7